MEALKKKKLYLMAGTPGSGKTYWIKNHISNFDEEVKVVSRDSIRFELLSPGEEYFSKEKEVWNTFVDRIKYHLNSYNVSTVIADATHLNEKSRSKLLNALGKTLTGIEVNIIVINSCLKKCLEQNENREGIKKVPSNVIKRMFHSFTMPTFEEGFDNIITYTKIGDNIKYTIERRGY